MIAFVAAVCGSGKALGLRLTLQTTFSTVCPLSGGTSLVNASSLILGPAEKLQRIGRFCRHVTSQPESLPALLDVTLRRGEDGVGNPKSHNSYASVTNPTLGWGIPGRLARPHSCSRIRPFLPAQPRRGHTRPTSLLISLRRRRGGVCGAGGFC
jgi:hypothetical protein